MKIANAKSVVAKLMLTGIAAAALMIANPAKAQAEVVVGIRAGYPVYAHPGIVIERRPEFLRREEFARREALLRHEEWLRAHRFDRGYGYR
jgi:hypothetical protein